MTTHLPASQRGRRNRVYEVKLSDGTVKNFGTPRGYDTVKPQLRVVFPSGVSFRRRGNDKWLPL